MSKPREVPNPNVEDVLLEVMSAMSSLNMPPEELEPPEDSHGWISERYEYAKHAYEHLRAAAHMLDKMWQMQNAQRKEGSS